MGRWLKQTDTLIIMTLGIGLFLFRFGDETWAAVTPHLNQVQNTLSAQLGRVTTSLTSQSESVQPEDSPATPPNVTSPTISTSNASLPDPRPRACIVIDSGCAYGHGCHY